jgi:hypothetical protein
MRSPYVLGHEYLFSLVYVTRQDVESIDFVVSRIQLLHVRSPLTSQTCSMIMEPYRGVVHKHRSDIEVACHINKAADLCSKQPAPLRFKMFAAVAALRSVAHHFSSALGMEQSLPDIGN